VNYDSLLQKLEYDDSESLYVAYEAAYDAAYDTIRSLGYPQLAGLVGANWWLGPRGWASGSQLVAGPPWLGPRGWAPAPGWPPWLAPVAGPRGWPPWLAPVAGPRGWPRGWPPWLAPVASCTRRWAMGAEAPKTPFFS